MQGIDNYTPKPNQISRIYNVAALLWFNLWYTCEYGDEPSGSKSAGNFLTNCRTS